MRRLAILAVLVLAGCGASRHAGLDPKPKTPVKDVVHRHARPVRTDASIALGLPPVRSRIVPGYLMIADRDNGRILVLDPDTRRIVWRFTGLRDPDDAFFAPGYRSISINEEYDQSIKVISLRTHRVTWTYGHPGQVGSAPGYLSNPDDAYVLRNGDVMVADIKNCRVLFISRAHRIVKEFGHAGSCAHDPPTSLSSPNGATPLADGGVLVTEIGGWVDRLDASGHLLYTVRTPTSYPSDAQLLPNGNILVAGFNTPGRVDEITPHGRIVWTYGPASGPGALDRPSLAVRWSNGMIAVTDDWHHRVVVVDPRTRRIVWQYGHLDQPGTAAGYLRKPDGLDLLPAGSRARLRSAPAHRATARAAARPGGTVRRIGTLPAALSKSAAVALPGGKLMVLGGLAGGSSTSQILLGTPAHLRAVGRLLTPTHDAAAALVGRSVYLFGGGQSVSSDGVVRVDEAGSARTVGPLDEPLSDLGAVTIGRRAYLVGGYTSVRFASAILRYGGGKTSTVARLPTGTRYAGVAAIGRTIYVAGGLTTSGPTDAVYAVTGAHVKRVATLPAPSDHAGLAALGGKLYLVGGRRILAIDPSSGAVAQAARLPSALTDPSVVALAGRLVIVGGGTDAVYSFSP
jgi:hypothetical protein